MGGKTHMLNIQHNVVRIHDTDITPTDQFIATQE
jgi:hypothetical protein